MRDAVANLSGNKWLSAIIVTSGIFMALLDTTIVDIVLPKMMSSFEVDLNKIQWVIISYFLGSIISMMCVGWFGDRFGAKNVFILGLMIFTGLSAICGIAPNMEIMNIGRFIQGIGEGFIVPSGMVVLYESFPKSERGIAMGLFGLGGAFAPAVGPSLGGLITEHMTWRWIFYINLPIGFIAAFSGWLLLRANGESRLKNPFDWIGFILMSISLSALIVFTTKGQENGWLQSDFIVMLIIIFCIFFPLFILWQLKAKYPLIDLNLFRDRTFSISLCMLGLVSFAIYGFFLLLPVYLEQLRGFTTLTSGLILLPGSIVGAISILTAGILCDRWRPRVVLFITLIGGILSCFLFKTDLVVSKHEIAFHYGVWMIFTAASMVPLMIISLSNLSEEQTNMGSTITNVVRLLLGSIGTSYSTAILANRSSEFYTILSAKVNYGEPAVKAYVGKALLLSQGMPIEDTLTKLKFALSQYIQALAMSYSFEAVFRTLGVWLIASIFLALLLNRIKIKHRSHGGIH